MSERVDPPGDWDLPPDDGDGAVALPPFLFDPLGVLRRRRLWMLGALLLGLAGTGAVLYTLEPTYRATATLLLTAQQIPEDFVRSTVREDTISNINAMFGRVLSMENLERLILKLGLFAERRDGTPPAELVGELRDGIEIGPEQGFAGGRHESSIIYGISYRSQSPSQAAAVANALAGLFMEASIERRSTQARRTTEFLRRQLERDEAELRAQSQAVADFRRDNRGELPEELDTNLRRLELLSERQHSLVAQIAAVESRLLTLADRPQRAETSANEALLEELRRELAQESAVHTDAHPNVVSLRARTQRLEELVAEERASAGDSAATSAARRELANLRRSLAETQLQAEQLDARVDRAPNTGERLAVLEQKEQVLRERYLDSLRKVERAELAESLESAQQGAQVSLLDTAQVPTAPERPAWLLGAGGVALSVLLAVALAVLLELFDPVIVNVAQLERVGERPCLGSLPVSA